MRTFRLAKMGDIPTLIRLGEQWLNPLWNKEEKIEIITREIKTPNHLIFIVEEANEIIAFCDIWHWHDWLTGKRIVNFLHVYVDENYRGQGIGTYMLTEIFKKIEWDFAFIDMKTEAAEKLYLKVGFKPNPKRKWMEIYHPDYLSRLESKNI